MPICLMITVFCKHIMLSGGTDKLAYRLSLGYNSEQGILITDKDRYKRLSGSAYISAEITSWLTQSVDIRYAQSDKNMPVTSDKTGLYDMRLPVVYPEGSLTLPDGTSLMTNTPSNVLRMATIITNMPVSRLSTIPSK